MAGRAEARKVELVDEVVRLVGARLPAGPGELVGRFVRRYLRDVAPEDLLDRQALDLYGAVLAHFRAGEQRRDGATKVRAYNPDLEQHGWQSTHTIVEIVNDDMPFLVDSVSMELSRHGLGIHLIIHPIMTVRRDARGRLEDVAGERRAADDGWQAESFMHFEIDRQSDEALLARLEGDLTRVLGDVRRAVEDWPEMRRRLDEAIAEWASSAPPELRRDGEVEAFLRWLAEDHFTFLGAAGYVLEDGAEAPRLRQTAGSALGILRDREAGGLSQSFSDLSPAARERARDPAVPLIVTKASSRSTVHRAAYLDYLGIKRYGPDGGVVGEHRFLGLLTSTAYSESPRDIPLLQRKVEQLLARSGFSRSGHAGKAFLHILETYPRDELLQTDEDSLFEIAMEILHLQDRQRLRLFLRRDPFERFVSCIVFVPRERYNTALRERLEGILKAALGAAESEWQAQVAESLLARIVFTFRTPSGVPDELDVADLERKLVEASQNWIDQLRTALADALGEEEGNRLLRLYGRSFAPSYQDTVPARAALPDIRHLDALAAGRQGPLALSLYRRLEDPAETVRFKIIRPDEPVLLSDALPILENMGVKVLSEEPTHLRSGEGRAFSIHDFGMQPLLASPVGVDEVRTKFQDAFLQVWTGRAENDGFNGLVLAAGLEARQITVLRAYFRYLLQLGVPFSQSYAERTLLANPALARLLVELFEARFDPARAEREAAVAAIEQAIEQALDQVAVLDEDRIVRAYLALIRATLRTNAWQRGPDGGPKEQLSFKIDPAAAPYMPVPRPAYEIFVYAPFVEGVHLRGGKVARGGLRWSDRREDFRTEVLGLMKAQMVKNSVIVPVGAKGGFVIKQPPSGADRAALQQEAIRCYRSFLSGMLDITDNRVHGNVVPPQDVVRYDGDDPYLVVAADKGTATFSDIANALSRDYGFWLDDAFASGGSAGYDHKGMGITAKGAWESVRRHFRELGHDPQSEPFTCVGVGDMSGDVFGNGMLMSRQIRLIAAFDHRHVFLDPDPDPATSSAERQRLFDLPRSSWADYEAGLISAGGGVWPRSAKRIQLSPQARAALAIGAESLSPAELCNAILKAPVDLLWNGGIGTFVKASTESHAEAQDRTNDTLRVDGAELRCRIVGEGGNLGMTQRGRIEFAAHGGRLNTDFIDNSAGVDCSDHEVNIKVLLNEVVAAGDMTLKQRDELLAAMTEEVGALVLRDNVLQNLALSVGQALGDELADARAGLMRRLERRGRLDRGIEMLPSDAELAERRKAGGGMTRPEAAVLLSYAKMTLYDDILASELPDRVYFLNSLVKYFPRPLRKRYPEEIARHRLRREIIATLLANSLINRGLEVFVSQLGDQTGSSLTEIVMAFVVARDAFDLVPFWGEVEALPESVPAALQIELLVAARQVLIAGTRWFLTSARRPLVIREAVGRFRPDIARLREVLEEVLAAPHLARFREQLARYSALGVEPPLARAAAGLALLVPASDIVAVARGRVGEDNGDLLLPAAVTYFALDAALELDRLREQLRGAPVHSRWDRLALGSLEDRLCEVLRRLTARALEHGIGRAGPAAAPEEVDAYLEGLHGHARYREIVEDIATAPAPDLAMLSVAVGVLNEVGVVAE
ncbi:NAD-glutamate dehydrogenase [Geminicoccaceae bacterium 1502E]|nr:NAD-glutamate dehydrogenase [Geminicoccaceae bacterium 1502E]